MIPMVATAVVELITEFHTMTNGHRMHSHFREATQRNDFVMCNWLRFGTSDYCGIAYILCTPLPSGIPVREYPYQCLTRD